jgi:hypothetical protein
VRASKRDQCMRILKRKTAMPAERVAHGLKLDEDVRHVTRWVWSYSRATLTEKVATPCRACVSSVALVNVRVEVRGNQGRLCRVPMGDHIPCDKRWAGSSKEGRKQAGTGNYKTMTKLAADLHMTVGKEYLARLESVKLGQ